MEEQYTPDRQPITERNLTSEEKFKILFPETDYGEMPVFDPGNIEWLIKKISVDPDYLEQGIKYMKASKNNGQRTREITTIPVKLDKLRAFFLTAHYEETTRQFHRIDFDDILKPEETIGGALELSIWEAIPKALRNYFEKHLPQLKQAIKEADEKKVPLYLIGVYDRNTKQPTRVIYYIEGDQIKGKRHKVQEQELGFALNPAIQTI